MIIKPHHYESSIIGMWRMGATINQMQDNGIPYTTYHIESIIEEYQTILKINANEENT